MIVDTRQSNLLARRSLLNYAVGIDDGTQALSVMFIASDGTVIAKGEHAVPMVAGLNGEREQNLDDWKTALSKAMRQAFTDTKTAGIELDNCLGVCPSAQMHGECLKLQGGSFHPLARLWCDSRNKDEAAELTNLFGLIIPQRLTIARWLWTIKHRPEIAEKVIGITTSAGVIASFLCKGVWALGCGDARGMFPIDQATLQYDTALVTKFNDYAGKCGFTVRTIEQLLPSPRSVGSIVGFVDEVGSALTGLPIGTPIYPPEGDQPTTLAGTYVSAPGTFAFSGGTSICANLITEQTFQGLHSGVEPFMAADGKPFLMCHVQNGTSFMNTVIGMFGQLLQSADLFVRLMPMAKNAAVDCGGIIVLPTAEAEHGLNFPETARSGIFNLRSDNATPGNLVRAALIGSMFSILYSVSAMRMQGITANKIVASGGIVKSDWIGQAIADIFNLNVEILGEAEEGSAYGAALMAMYGNSLKTSLALTWSSFIDSIRPKPAKVFEPIPANVATLRQMFDTFCQLVENVESKLVDLNWTK